MTTFLVIVAVTTICWFDGVAGRTIVEQTPYELDDLLLGKFLPTTWNGTWISGTSFVYQTSDEDLNKFDTETDSNTLLLTKTLLENYSGWSVSVSPDNLYILIKYNVSSIFRHSTTALFAIYDTQTRKIYDVASKNQTQQALWAPVGHSLAYIYENNIYYLDEPDAEAVPITTDGIPGVYYNGISDWVYEEEVLGTDALWFSPDAKRLAFAAFDDREVHEMHYILYGTPGSLEDQYPKVVSLRYPKVGTPNPTVRTYVVDLTSTSPAPKEIAGIPARFQPDDYVLYGITWPDNDTLVVLSTNRVQNRGELTRCNAIDVSCSKESEYDEKEGWLTPVLPKYDASGRKRLELLPQPEGDDRYDHIVLTDLDTKEIRRLTFGRFAVIKIIGWDEKKNLVYYTAAVEENAAQEHVYSVGLDDETVTCLTCSFITLSGPCSYASADFSKDFSRFAKICQGTGPHHVNIQTETSETLWLDNSELLEKLALKQQPIVQDYLVPVPGGFEARVRLFFPPEFDTSLKYPAIVYVYGGPDSNLVLDTYTAGLQNYLTTKRRYIYINIDGRGSGRGSKKKSFSVYRQLGTVEIEDQIAVTRYLLGNCPYIDPENVGIWGWSYGGFASAWSLVQDKEKIFKFALSVAPVTSFIYYDSIYTERYMGLPTAEDNLAGYNGTDLTRNVEGFRNRTYFLIHGNADDNVHYQQSMLLSKALEIADIQFRQQSYPDENHSIGNVRTHLYHNIDLFFAKILGTSQPLTRYVHLIKNIL